MITTSITWSSYSTAQSCRRKYWLAYCEGVELADRSEAKSDALLIGDAVHRLCGGEPTVPDLPEHLGPIVSTMSATWLIRYGECTLGPERQIEAWVTDEVGVGIGDKVVSVTLGAHCDEIRKTEDRRIVVERKTAKRVDGNYLERLALDQQIALQAYLADVDTVIYDVIQVAPIKRELGETDQDFAERRAKAKAKNKSGTTNVKRRVEEHPWLYSQRLVKWYIDHPEALLRYDVTIEQERKIAAVSQIAGLAASLRLAQLDVLEQEEHDREAQIDLHFAQSTQRCFDWGRRCEYWALCTSGNSELVKQQLYTIRPKREGDPPTNRETMTEEPIEYVDPHTEAELARGAQ